jgi:flagellar protein FlgJ
MDKPLNISDLLPARTDGAHLGATPGGDPKLRAAAQQFEALFVQMVMKSMREAKLADGLFDSSQSDLYQGMQDAEMAKAIAGRTGGGLGLSELILRQLGGAPQGPVPAVNAMNAYPLPARMPGTVGENKQALPLLGDSPEAFVENIFPHAQKAAEALGIDARALVAQSALETGWGTKVAAHADGRSSYNVFGIKAGPAWEGETVRVPTTEFENGRPVRRMDSFRAYPSLEAAFDDYVTLIDQHPRYAEARTAASVTQYAEALQQAGYATDPAYAAKIKTIAAGNAVEQAMLALKLMS